MIFKFIMFVALIATSQLVQAENHLLLIGGGGEPEGDGTIFDTNLYILGSNLKNLKWNYEISFNGGHKKTEEIIEKI